MVVDSEGCTLLVRKRGTEAFMQPGGKIADGETAIEALERELLEELGCCIGGHRALGRFSAIAANETDTIVEAELFAVELSGEIAPASEIEELRWHHFDDVGGWTLAPLTRDQVLPLVRAWVQE